MKGSAGKRVLQILAAGLVLSLGAGCQTTPAQKGSLTQILQQKMQNLAENGDFGGSLGVIYQGQVLLQVGYGWADYEKKIPCTKDTNYRIGSVTKQFTAAGLLVLAQQGKLSPQDTLDKWVPEYAHGSEVTLHQLATNSSGLPYTYPDQKTDMPFSHLPITPVEIVDRYENTPFKFKPGTGFEYSNFGFSLLGLALSRASGMSYESFVETQIFKPNGLDRSALDKAPDLAQGYMMIDADKSPEDFHPTWAYAAGAVESNVVDMGKWLEALAAGKVLTSDSLKTLMTPVHGDYAYGWWSREIPYQDRTIIVLAHSGGYPGYVNQVLWVPELRLSVVALCNQTDVNQGLLEDIMELVLSHPQK